MEAIDLGTVFFFATHRNPVVDALVVAITRVGNFEVMFPLAVVFTFALARLRGWRTATLYAGTALLTYFVCLGTQHAVGRERPDVLEMVIPKPTQPSFPSGHATNSLVVLGLFGLLSTRDVKSVRLKWTVRVLLVGVLPLLIGFSRIYLTVHYVSDVVSGWLLASAILFLASGLDRPGPVERLTAPAPGTEGGLPGNRPREMERRPTGSVPSDSIQPARHDVTESPNDSR